MVGEGADECDGRGKKIRERGREGQDMIKEAKFLFLFVWGARAEQTRRGGWLAALLPLRVPAFIRRLLVGLGC